MKISIIVPAYNAENTIERCLQSIILQDVDDLQVVVIDDYSEDSTFIKCREIQKKYSNIELYQTFGKGVSAARNTGLKHVKGDIIGFCDADDYFEEGAFVKILNEFTNDVELDLCCIGLNNRSTDGSAINKKIPRRGSIMAHEMLEHVLCDDNVMGSVCNKFYKWDILQDVFFDESLTYCEDTYFNAILLAKNKDMKCLLINEPLYNYVSNYQSATHDISRMYNEAGELKYNETMYQIESDCNLTHVERKYIRRALYKLSVENYNYSCIDNSKKEKLLYEIKRNILCFAKAFYRFNIKTSVKYILLGVIIITKNLWKN